MDDARTGQAQSRAKDIGQIMEMIPHRYPFLMIDRIQEIVPNEYAIGIKNVSMNEWYFEGHFPRHPVMPGVLIIEAMAQTAAVMVVESLGADTAGKLVYFMSIEEARFRKPVAPGDILEIKVSRLRGRPTVWKCKGEATVGGNLVAEAQFTAMILDREPE